MGFFGKNKPPRPPAKKKSSDPTVATIYSHGPSQSTWSVATPLPPYSPPHTSHQDSFQHSPNLQPIDLNHAAQPCSTPAFYPSFAPAAPFPYASPPYQQQPAWISCTNLATTALSNVNANVNATLDKAINTTSEVFNHGSFMSDMISNKFDDVISLIDDEIFTGAEKELTITYHEPPYRVHTDIPGGDPMSRHKKGANVDQVTLRGGGQAVKDKTTYAANRAATNTITHTNFFAKANLYANSRFPPNLPPLKVYMPTYPLICLASQYSMGVYRKPRGKEKDTHVAASWRMGTKAMVMKSVPIDDMNTIVFAIRGTQTFFDWAVNLNTSPVSPQGFLDDPGNLCHSGFLDVAKKMVKPVAARLRQMLEENPSRASCSLLITGHSAGGAVASLIFCHMLSDTIKSDLTYLTGCFKRVHCIVFGAPPISLLPLSKPINREHHLRKSLFLSFINEGDPVPRADRPYVRSLLELYGSPSPMLTTRPPLKTNKFASTSKVNLAITGTSGKCGGKNKKPKPPPRRNTDPTYDAQNAPGLSNVVWPLPPPILSNAGRLVILRVPVNSFGAVTDTNEEDVRACTATHEQMRSVVFGDPLMHQMAIYAKRVEIVATKAVTGKLFS